MTKNISNNAQKLFLKGSEAIARIVANCQPGVIAAYPITPQTGIIEELVRLKTQRQANFSFIQTESEHSALSVVLGAAAMGVPAYTATSSQGLLHMAEVIYNLPGLRLPVVMTCANRSISAPINIWNDHQDAMAVRDAGWIMLWAEDVQEAIEQHWLAFILSQKLRLPVMINVDGFRLTHASEPVILPSTKLIHKLLTNKIKPVLDINKPQTTGWFALPEVYHRQRLSLRKFIAASWPIIKKNSQQLNNLWQPIKKELLGQGGHDSNSAVEYYGSAQARLVIVAMGSIIGELKNLADEANKQKPRSVAILKIKLYRPFPEEVIQQYLNKAGQIVIIDRSPGLGAQPPLFSDIMAINQLTKNNISSIIIGLGGDIDLIKINKIIKKHGQLSS
ncbi:MAG TPA: pyruvate ferredoxin oxidoreductase [bacterium]|jgi:pyruvate ferredoxin oxidoreductase alpha subunit|nr:pyruvate ferredoxin oxidoreductase [bacterium]HOR69483.1 pyruvate ferredoxin oxidoreductase [bacterium]HPD03454.1 pyruvate ferredoxin oxidoreductase [bacterium]HRS72983.1 pyruvate ferredoxin oxidoreductase [Patescibacteria group bacterium]